MSGFNVRGREIPLAIFSICMLLPVLGAHLNVPILEESGDNIVTWGVYMANFALLLGLIVSLRYHLKFISKKEPEQWPFSILTITCAFTMLLSSFIMPTLQEWLYENLFQPAVITVTSFVGFYGYNAIYGGFRARNKYVLVFLLSAVFVMFTYMPMVELVAPLLPGIGNWINSVPTTAGMRGIIIGIAVGLIAMTIRTVLGYEKAFMGGSE